MILRRCSRRSPTRRSTIPSSSTNRSTTASARSSRSTPKGRRAPVVAARQREDAPVPGDRRRARDVGARTQGAELVLDGEIVALDAKGEPTGFQQLQGRIHLAGRSDASVRRARRRLHRLRHPARRAHGPSRAARCSSAAPRSSGCSVRDTGYPRDPAHQRDGARRRPRAVRSARSASGWEGLIAKHADSRYQSGKRTPDWRKLKIVHEQEFVIGGWTEPRQTRVVFRRAAARRLRKRSHASLTCLVYVGHTGTGFNERSSRG